MNTQPVSSTIRDRGQLTIPDEFREKLPWLTTGSPVRIIATTGEIKIIPYAAKGTSHDWKAMWEAITLARSFKGNGKSLSKFIIKDRQSH